MRDSAAFSPRVSPEKNLHLAIIPDGNRRWARERSLLPWNGHERAIGNFRSILEWCRAHPRIGILTLWCFSTENWKRSSDEIAVLMRLYEDYLRAEQPKFREERTRLLHSGRRDRIPKSLAELLRELEEETNTFNDFTLHLAIDYGGRDEILRAVRRSAGTENGQRTALGSNRTQAEMTDESFRAHLDHPELPDIDVILRTSGERRTSNFFLWQTTYSEWIFTEKLFPELSTDDLAAALEEFERRKRRFGR